ncbi:MAG: peptidoglycan editing factor PgeF [Culicoidibacterales bacterium]
MIEPFRLENGLLYVREWEQRFPQFIAGFTTRLDGVSQSRFTGNNIAYQVGDIPAYVQANRKKMGEKLGFNWESWVVAAQAHTNVVAEVTTADCGAGTHDFESGIPATDGLYTKDKNVLLTAFYADCVPLLFIAPTHNLVGVVHAGWQGTVKEITRVFVQNWLDLGVKPAEIHVAIGPAISKANYRVDLPVIEQVLAMETANTELAFSDLGTGEYKLDTPYLNELQLLDLGIPSENILRTSYCTVADIDLFYSYRKEGLTGRMMAFIAQK